MQKRHRHFIQPVTTSVYPSIIVSVEAHGSLTRDGEEGEFIYESLVGWTAAVATYKHGIPNKCFEAIGDTIEDWWRYLDLVRRTHNDCLVVSWNAARNITLLGFWRGLESGVFYMTGKDRARESKSRKLSDSTMSGYWVLQNPPTIVSFRSTTQQGKITWLDMRNFGYSKLTQIGSECISPRRNLITLTDIIRWLRMSNLGSLKHTVGSQALHTFKYRYLRHSIHVNTSESTNTIGECAVYGGRCEAYRIGDVQGCFTHYDINSLYPSLYATKSLPVRFIRRVSNPSDSDIGHGMREQNCIACIQCETSVPCLPYKRNDRLIFPIGRFETTVAFPELELAFSLCKSVKVVSMSFYDMAPCLADYAKDLYAKRIKAKHLGMEALASYIKYMLVCLPGKFGQRRRVWEIAADQRCSEPWHYWNRRKPNGEFVRCRSVAWTVEEERDRGLAPESVPEITAFVNSWGRRTLWDWMVKEGRENVVYCDTDAIIRYGVRGSEEATKYTGDVHGIGEIRIEGRYSRLSIYGQKHYSTNDRCVPRPHTEIASGGILAPGEQVNQSFVSDWFGRGSPIMQSYRVVKPEPIKPYTAGNVQPDGRITPIELEEW